MKGYKIDKLLFRIIFFLIMSFLVITVLVDGIHLNNQFYVNCPEDAPGGRCYNPLYNNESCDNEFCRYEMITAGTTMGTPPSDFYKAAPFVAFFGVVAFIFGNHFIYNRGFKPDEGNTNKDQDD